MPVKEFQLGSGLKLKVYKRSTSRHLRILIDNDNNVKVSIPTWAPYQAGVNFAASKTDWINAKLTPRRILKTGDLIGKHHRLYFKSTKSERLSTKISDLSVFVYVPSRLTEDSEAVQAAARQAAARALKSEATSLLIGRLEAIAKRHDFKISSIKIKSLKSRWGSCDKRGNIALSCYLMLLPWELIDYVLCHELTHLKHHNHSPSFWAHLESIQPATKELRRQLRDHRASLAT